MTVTGTEVASDLPKRVKVKEVIKSRYQTEDGKPVLSRPFSWDKRKAGMDIVITSDDQEVKLQSDGQQSPPKPGWTLMLTNGDKDSGYEWTLYGMQA